MSLDAIYSEDIAGRNNIMRERWDNSGITVGCVGDLSGFRPFVDSLPWLTIATSSNDILKAQKSGGQ